MLKHFMKFRPGWWILHGLAVAATFLLGGFTRF